MGTNRADKQDEVTAKSLGETKSLSAVPSKRLEDLTEIQIKILAILACDGGAGEIYYHHDWILGGGNYNDPIDKSVGGKKGLSKELKVLRELGYVEYMRGLMSDEGELMGAGNNITGNHTKRDEVYDYLEAKGLL